MFENIILIQAALIHKIKVFLNIFIREISNMPLILSFSHIFYFERCLRKIITEDIFFLNKRILLFDGPIVPQT